MKKIILMLAVVLIASLSSVSCTTDSYDADMENNTTNIHADDTNETAQTDPIIIPKKD
ncbi:MULTISPECIES: hypothetical protein [unclassified Flavobacterium]|uniref:hypothetical protein n=1 Tax=unclassified Flavobacterium TaxID=196869 RepID=UPI0020905DDE|nr:MULTISPECIES: hypothetical protein [unclassified Flavobacterium]MCO6161655.1 hypothetical protein [Flavobacterium sp. NRK F7]|tara:strand:+ start:844 stop:1017 length:174 start_codon:yes stop_codon:yes gene_type:complete